ncbi:MAG: tetratricopeptide repeat protein [Bacteroidota bacterium]
MHRLGIPGLASLAAAALFGASTGTAAPLAFHWPVPARVRVTVISQNDSSGLVHQEVAHVFATPNPSELKLRTEDVQLWDFLVAGRRPPGGLSFLSAFANLATSQPPITISPDGDFKGCQVTEEFLAQAEEALRQTLGAVVDSSVLRRAFAMIRTPQMKAQMELSSAQDWNNWVGDWVGMDVPSGGAIEGTRSMSWVGTTLPFDVVVENEGPTRPGGRLIRLTQISRVGGAVAVKAMEGYLRSLAASVPGVSPVPDHFLRSVTRTETESVVLDPATMRPHFAGRTMLIEVADSLGTRTKYKAEGDFFDWDPPLQTGSRFDSIPAAGLAAFFQGRLSDAYDTLRTAVENGTNNPETYAYLAQTCRRLNEMGQAAYFARRALALSPRNGFAHQTLAECYGPQFNGGWTYANDDSSWTQLGRAIECDSTDGNVWLQVHTDARRRDLRDLERHALARLIDTGFLPRPSLAYARWMVQDLPESTVLITNGDMDSYPLWALQATAGLRPDVAVVNYSMLDASWYARKTRDDLHVPLPFSDADLDSLDAAPDSIPMRARVLAGWLEGKDPGAYRRPVAISITVDPSTYPAGIESRVTLVGPAFACSPSAHPFEIDTTAARVSLAHARASDFVGPVFTERDRSPVRRSASRLSDAIVGLWLQYAARLSDAGRRRESLEAIGRASSFAKTTDAGQDVRGQIEALRAQVQTGKGAP